MEVSSFVGNSAKSLRAVLVLLVIEKPINITNKILQDDIEKNE